MSEPGGGSDVASLTTSARRDGGDLVINGTKMWITNGLQVKTRTPFERRTLSFNFYLVGGLGVSVGEHEHIISIKRGPKY